MEENKLESRVTKFKSYRQEIEGMSTDNLRDSKESYSYHHLDRQALESMNQTVKLENTTNTAFSIPADTISLKEDNDYRAKYKSVTHYRWLIFALIGAAILITGVILMFYFLVF